MRGDSPEHGFGFQMLNEFCFGFWQVAGIHGFVAVGDAGSHRYRRDGRRVVARDDFEGHALAVEIVKYLRGIGADGVFQQHQRDWLDAAGQVFGGEMPGGVAEG